MLYLKKIRKIAIEYKRKKSACKSIHNKTQKCLWLKNDNLTKFYL